MVINSIISYGFVDLIETFFKANNLEVECTVRQEGSKNLIIFEYEDDSETALAITFMSVRHLGFENMLVDYIVRCGYSLSMISIGRTIVRRDMKALDRAWEEKRKELGFR